MSGGFFNYKNYEIDNLVYELELFLKRQKHFQENPDSVESNDYHRYNYNFDLKEETFLKIEKTIQFLKLSSIMIHRVDWLLSGDDGEETFHKRWEEDVLFENI